MTAKLRNLLVPVAAAAALFAGGSQAASADTVTIRIDAPSIDGALTFSNSAGSLRCTTPVCSVRVPLGQPVTITAEGSAASAFESWGGVCAVYGSQPTCGLQPTADVSASARFSHVRLWLLAFGAGSFALDTPGRACGSGCADFRPGEKIAIHARPAQGWDVTSWGGSCTGVRTDQYCILTLRRNSSVSVTFEPHREPPACEPGRSCDPVDPAIRFQVLVTGAGAVFAPKVRTIGQVTCQNWTSGVASCVVDRPVERRVYFYARGLHFRRWGGRCAGQRTTTCSFVNDPSSGAQPLVTAQFG